MGRPQASGQSWAFTPGLGIWHRPVGGERLRHWGAWQGPARPHRRPGRAAARSAQHRGILPVPCIDRIRSRHGRQTPRLSRACPPGHFASSACGMAAHGRRPRHRTIAAAFRIAAAAAAASATPKGSHAAPLRSSICLAPPRSILRAAGPCHGPLHAAAALSTFVRPRPRAAAAAALAVSCRIRAAACTDSSILPSTATDSAILLCIIPHVGLYRRQLGAVRPLREHGRPPPGRSGRQPCRIARERLGPAERDPCRPCRRQRMVARAGGPIGHGSGVLRVPRPPYALDARCRSAAALSSLDDRANAPDARTSGSAARPIASPARPNEAASIVPCPSTARPHFSAAHFIASPNSTLAAHPLRHSANDARLRMAAVHDMASAAASHSAAASAGSASIRRGAAARRLYAVPSAARLAARFDHLPGRHAAAARRASSMASSHAAAASCAPGGAAPGSPAASAALAAAFAHRRMSPAAGPRGPARILRLARPPCAIALGAGAHPGLPVGPCGPAAGPRAPASPPGRAFHPHARAIRAAFAPMPAFEARLPAARARSAASRPRPAPPSPRTCRAGTRACPCQS